MSSSNNGTDDAIHMAAPAAAEGQSDQKQQPVVLANLDKSGCATVTSSASTKRALETTNEVEEPPRKKPAYTNRNWERGYEALAVYKKKHGTCIVPYRYAEDPSLGAWTARQRKQKDELTPEQIERLDQLGFSWESSQDRVWMEKFDRLKAYFNRFGNSSVPTSYGDDLELGEWVAKQRQKHKEGRLSEDRQKLLRTVNFVFRINKVITRKCTEREDKRWYEQFERLLQFVLEHGHTLVPFQYFADTSLGRWVNEQRCQNTRNLLRQDRKTILDSVGFKWKVSSRKGELVLEKDADEEARWCFQFRQLVEYNKAHGSFDNIPNSQIEGTLGFWAAQQKALMQKRKLDETKAQRFATIGFCDAGEAVMWETNYQKLLKAGYSSIFTLQDPALCHWVICQRYLHKKGQLSNERKMKLFEVPGMMWDSTPLNLPAPQPKHILKERKRQENNNMKSSNSVKKAKKVAKAKTVSKPKIRKAAAATLPQKLAKAVQKTVAATAIAMRKPEEDPASSTDTESDEEDACVGLLSIANKSGSL